MAKIHNELELAGLHITKCHNNAALLQNKRERLETLLDRVAQQQKEAQNETKAAIDFFSMLKRQAKSIEEDIRIAKSQQKLYDTIRLQQLYNNTCAQILDDCPLNKNEILVMMEEEMVRDSKSMDDFISLLYVKGYLSKVPATGGSTTTNLPEQQGEQKGEATSTLTTVVPQGETKEVTTAKPIINMGKWASPNPTTTAFKFGDWGNTSTTTNVDIQDASLDSTDTNTTPVLPQGEIKEATNASPTTTATATPPLKPGGPVLKPLKRSDTGWKKTEAKDDVDKARKTTIALLNKLTAENFDKINGQMMEVDMSSGTKVMRQVIDQIFDKALSQHSFTDTYAKLCHAMSTNSDLLQSQFVEVIPVEVEGAAAGEMMWCWRDGSSDPKGSERDGGDMSPFATEAECSEHAMKQTHFKRILLNKCQEEFEKEDIYEARTKLEEVADAQAERDGKVWTAEEKALTAFIRKRERKELRTRRLGNTLFIGSLFKLEMLSERIMHQCINELIGDYENPDVESIEALNKLLSSVGKTLDNRGRKTTKKAKTTREYMKLYFDNIQGFSRHPKLDKRTQFMCRDVLDLRSNNWVPKRKTLQVKTIAKVHKEAQEAQEEKAEKERQARQGSRNNSNNRRSGGGGGSNNRGSQRGGQGMARVQNDVRGGQRAGGGQRVAVQGNLRVSRGGGGNGMRPGGGSGGGMRPGGRGGMRPGGNNGGGNTRPQQQRQQVARPIPTAAPTMSASDITKSCGSIIREYLKIRDISEVLARLKELPTEKSAHIFVEQAVDTLLNARTGQRPLVEDVLCAVAEKKCISSSALAKGFSTTFEFLIDVKVDMPLCDQWIGHLFGRLISFISPKDFAVLFTNLGSSESQDVADVRAGLFIGILKAWKEATASTPTEEKSSASPSSSTSTTSSTSLFCSTLLTPGFQTLVSSASREMIKTTREKEWKYGATILAMTNPTKVLTKEQIAQSCVPVLTCVQHVRSMLHSGCECDAILNWMSTNVPTSVMDSSEYGREIVMSVCSMALVGGQCSVELITELLVKNGNLLKVVLDRRPVAQVQSLYGVAELCRTYKCKLWPFGYCLGIVWVLLCFGLFFVVFCAFWKFALTIHNFVVPFRR